MQEKEPDAFSEAFTGEHAYLGDYVRDARAKMDQIDAELDTLPASPQPNLGLSNGRDNNFAFERRSQLEAQKHQLGADTKKYVEEATKGKNVETQKEYQQKVDYLMDSRNKDLTRTAKDQKSHEVSFERMASQHFRKKELSENNNPEKPKHVDKASDRFNQMVQTQKSKEIVKDNRQPEISQPQPSYNQQVNVSFQGYQSASVRFNNRASQFSENRGDATKKETISLDKPESKQVESGADRFNQKISQFSENKEGGMKKETLALEQPETKQLESGAERFNNNIELNDKTNDVAVAEPVMETTDKEIGSLGEDVSNEPEPSKDEGPSMDMDKD